MSAFRAFACVIHGSTKLELILLVAAKTAQVKSLGAAGREACVLAIPVSSQDLLQRQKSWESKQAVPMQNPCAMP